MLHQKINSGDYIKSFSEKFNNFIIKAPVLASFVVTPEGVDVIHENTKKIYHYDWDFTQHVKSFIHEIKLDLINHYPRLQTSAVNKVSLKPEQQAQLIAEGKYEVDNVPSFLTEKKETIWRIDKVIVYKDIFIVVNEDTEETFRYKMDRSCVYFLKSYRSGKYKSLLEAGDYFFSNSKLLNKIDLKESASA